MVRKFDYRLVIEVESGHGIVGLRLGRLFLNAEYLPRSSNSTTP
jgi:hypothetical protein